MRNNKQSEEGLVERAVKNTIQILDDRRLFDIYDIAAEVLQEFFLIEKNERCRLVLEELKDDIVDR